MKKLIKTAVDDLLINNGFSRVSGQEWIRNYGIYSDIINIQLSSFLDSITVNILFIDESIHELLLELNPSRQFEKYPVNVRLPRLAYGRDHWWKRSDPAAPDEIVEALKQYGLPFLEGLHSPEGFLAYLLPRAEKWRSPIGRLYAAIILHRMARVEEADALLDQVPRLVEKGKVNAVRNYCGLPALP